MKLEVAHNKALNPSYAWEGRFIRRFAPQQRPLARRYMLSAVRTIFTLIAMLVVTSCGAENIDVQGVRVLDSNFEEVSRLESKVFLKKFESEWEKFEEVVSKDVIETVNWSYKLDIDSENIGGRWLYDPSGYVGRLNKLLEPIYIVRDTNIQNELLGI